MDLTYEFIYSIVEKVMKNNQKEEEPVGFLTEALGMRAKEVISLVGAGGKTTLMFRLAKELVQNGKKVVTTTTTKILEPVSGETGSLYINPDEEKIKDFVVRHLNLYHHITVAQERLGLRKLKGISPNLVDELWNLEEIDTVIIEADGAAGRPVKAPREWEPVIPLSTTLIVGILGVDGVGAVLNEENVFQPKQVSGLTGIPEGGKITDEAMAILIAHPNGIYKGAPASSRMIVFLNKVDISNGVPKAKSIARKIIDKRYQPIERIVLGQLHNEPPVVEVIFP
jgi:probable selenium-dependent hydroxylase accessory protein YqeC